MANLITTLKFELSFMMIWRSRMLIRCDNNNQLFLYDIVRIKKETSTPL